MEKINTIALDTEVTGVDHYHGARVFFVTTYDKSETNTFWEWPVDPLTRKPIIPQDDIATLVALLTDTNNHFVLHNSRFDYAALSMILPLPQEFWVSLWDRTDDTLAMAHVLGSAHKHGLDDCAVQYLGYRKMNDYEDRVEAACKKARDYARRYLKDWRITKPGLPDMPSAKPSSGSSKNSQDKDKNWKSDMWLLKAILDHPSHPQEMSERIEQFRKDWRGEDGDGLTADYANLDTAVTYKLYPVMKKELHRRGLWATYKHRMKLMPIAFRMEKNALTISAARLQEQVVKFSKGVSEAKQTCVDIAAEMNYPLQLPAGSSNNASLKTFFFGEATVSCANCKKRLTDAKGNVVNDRSLVPQYKDKTGVCRFCKQKASAVVREWPWLDLPVLKETESGQPSLDKDVMEQYLNGEDLSDTQRRFLVALQSIRGGGKALEALKGYQEYWLPCHPLPGNKAVPDPRYHRVNPRTEEVEHLWYRIHPNLNPQGTDTLRWGSKNPNLQNISKKKEYNLRFPFGPAPGREAWSFDFRNIELRIPTYGCGQQELIDLFERCDEPPFYGSEHLLNFSVIYPEIWEKELPEQMKNPEHIKTKYKDTYYQWIKNTDFALQYNCGEAKADATARRKGVKKSLQSRFKHKTSYATYWINYANKHGFVETMPRRDVDPKRGYPLMTQRTMQFGRSQVSPTIPLAYHVSGTAMDLTAAAMIECQKQLDVWNRECGIPDNYRMVLQVHDELFFDWPKAEHPKKNPRRSNLARARIIQRVMEQCGAQIVCRRVAMDNKEVDLPTPVSVDYHEVSWDKAEAL